MVESKLDVWLQKEAQLEEPNVVPNLVQHKKGTKVEKKRPKKTHQFELLKEEVIGDVKVIKRRCARYSYIEVRAVSLIGKTIDGSKGFAQYLPTWHNEQCNGPKLAEYYFQLLVAWFQGGRQGRILPYDYPEEE